MTPSAHERRRHPGAAVLLAAVLVVLTVGGGTTTPPPSDPTSPPPDLTSSAAPSSAPAQRECTSSRKGDCQGTLPVAAGRTVHYFRNYPLTGSPAVTSAVIAVHGAARNAWSSFTGIRQEAARAGANDHTLVLAPSFKTDEDDPADDEARWSDQAWKQGGDAERPRGVSSFDAMDGIVRSLSDRARFPRLTRITLTGHSAGGQFTQRYAALGKAVPRESGVTMNFVPANPSSFLYLSPERPDPTDPSGQRFRRPETSCAYDEYKFGLRDRDRYARDIPSERIVEQYLAQHVVYLQGERDTGSDNLDTTCAAKLQGRNRIDRGELYAAYIESRFPAARHRLLTVPGVGHDRGAMLGSPQGVSVLFGVSPHAETHR